MEVVKLPFLPRVPPSSSKLNIAKVQALGHRQTVGVVEAKILAQGTLSKVVPVNGTDCELKEFQIGDSSGQAQLTLWDKQIVQVCALKSYKFTNLSTREREGRIYLSGSPSTTITEIRGIEVADCSELGEGEKLSELSGTVTGIQVICKRRCPKCRTPQGEFKAKSSVHRCESCKLLQKSCCYSTTYRGTMSLTIDGTDHGLTVTNSAISAYFTEYNMCHLLNDVEDMEEHFIDVAEFNVSVNEENLITTIKQRFEKKEDTCAEDDGGPGNGVDGL